MGMKKGEGYSGGIPEAGGGCPLGPDPMEGEIECVEGSRDQRYFQGWPLDSPHVCHGIRHADCPTLFFPGLPAGSLGSN